MSAPSAKSPSINQKLSSLDEKIAWFYSDDFSLDSAQKNYEAALSLAKEIETDLTNLKNHIEVLSKSFTT
ncbi:hypothetical protein IJI72_03310 [Candidatus Saccharibacteria bacterium]|nr:hypothetical protein [Candidatus Saccharibacteria bacterium]